MNVSFKGYFVKKTGLFDPEYYLSENPDVSEAGFDPLAHYILFGDREGRQPCPLFSPKYYRSQTNSKLKSVNSLLHYALVGRHQGLSPSPWFDVTFYLQTNRDVAYSGKDPLFHYLNKGGQEGRSPNPTFDGLFYLSQNPELVDIGINPLLHYLNYGVYRNYPINPKYAKNHKTNKQNVPPIDITNVDNWKNLTSRKEVHDAKVDVVIPVYKNLQLTLKAIYSVLNSNNQLAFELIVINDASPEPAVTEKLQQLSKLNLFTLIENSENLGFVKTVNKGILAHLNRDVLLLNSDAEVYNDWLDRLFAISRDPLVASVTPLSNNATICSYPRFLHDNPYPLELPYSELDQVAAKVNNGLVAEAPTGVGFCMYLCRTALNQVGVFDEETFGIGYGEENDWCQRAIQKGFKNLITSNVFVRHFGRASFQGAHAERVSNAMKIIGNRYPDYHQQVQDYIKSDPLNEARQNLDKARLVRYSNPQNTLIISHNRGGGTERHIQEETMQLKEQGQGVFYLRPEKEGLDVVRLSHHSCINIVNLPDYSLDKNEPLIDILKEINITHVHTHGLVDYSHQAPMKVGQLVSALNCQFFIEIHDYKVICPRINLVNSEGRFCGDPTVEACQKCLSQSKNSFNQRDIVDWRSHHYRVLKQADAVYVPDEDVSNRLKRYYSDVNYVVEPHSDIDLSKVRISRPVLNENEDLQIVVIGAISRIKGFDLLVSLAKLIQQKKLPIKISVMGFTLKDKLLEKHGVLITGKYNEAMADDVLKNLPADVVLLPSIWPETYSYTLSLALKHSKPVFAFDIGAIPNRLRRVGFEQGIMPVEFMDNPQQVLNLLLDYRQELIYETHR